jgi:hypothetical protein
MEPRSPLDFRDLAAQPWTVFVWGESRAVTNRVLFAMAQEADPKLFWFEIGSDAESTKEPGPVESGWIPSDRLYRTHALDEAKPQPEVHDPGLKRVVRYDEPGGDLLASFLRLPPTTQEILGTMGPPGSRRAIVFANVERVREYYPTTVDGVRPLLQALAHSGVSSYFSLIGSPRMARMAFDYVFAIKGAKELDRWMDGTIVCEHAPPGSDVKIGEPVKLSNVPSIAAVFDLSVARA